VVRDNFGILIVSGENVSLAIKTFQLESFGTSYQNNYQGANHRKAEYRLKHASFKKTP